MTSAVPDAEAAGEHGAKDSGTPSADAPPAGSQFALLRQRRFAPFFWTQFLGAFNDNLFKTALLTALAYDAARWTTADPALLNNLIPGLFILPFLLASATAGQLADKFDRTRVARAVKLLEIAIMAVAAIGWSQQRLWLLVAAVVGMGLHSTLFGPVKYAYLPQHLNLAELTGGNGLVEMGTFVGILLGQVAGAVLAARGPAGPLAVAGAALAVAVAGWLASRRMPPSPPPDPGLRVSANPLAETVRLFRAARASRPVFVAMLANSWFWCYGALLLAQFPLYARAVLHGDYSVLVLLLAVFSVGIGAGSLLCERLSGRRIEIGLVPLGALGLSAFGIDLYFASLAYAGAAGGMNDAVGAFAFAGPGARILADCLLIGVFGGFYIVPLFSVIQTCGEPGRLSRTIATTNVLNAVFMVAAALAGAALLRAGLSIPQLFLAAALANAAFAAAVFAAAPEYLKRFAAWAGGLARRGTPS